MADKDQMDCVFRMSKKQGLSLGIQLASGSHYSGNTRMVRIGYATCRQG